MLHLGKAAENRVRGQGRESPCSRQTTERVSDFEVWGLQRLVDLRLKTRYGSEPVESRGSASALRIRGGGRGGVVEPRHETALPLALTTGTSGRQSQLALAGKAKHQHQPTRSGTV
jgi:hypothetical protein